MYAQEEDDESYELVQTADRENDSDDLPLGMDPIDLSDKKPEQPEARNDEAEEENAPVAAAANNPVAPFLLAADDDNEEEA